MRLQRVLAGLSPHPNPPPQAGEGIRGVAVLTLPRLRGREARVSARVGAGSR